MKIFQLCADVKLLTLNKAYITLPNGRRCPSSDYKLFKKTISDLMKHCKRNFNLFDNCFDSKLHEIHGYLEYHVPSLYTKDGRISKNSGDLGNMEKCLIDVVLAPIEKDGLCRNIDDSAITKWEKHKINSDKFMFFLKLEIIER